jgi:two-component system, NarL family, sensor kinase
MPLNSYCMFKDVGEESLTTLIVLGTIILVVLVSFVILLSYFFTARKNKLLKEKELLHAQFQQELLRTQLEIQEQTLNTISQEIHDNVGQVLSLAKLNLNTLPNNSDQKIQDTKNLVSKAINDLRNLSHSLHGDVIAAHGLQQSIVNELNIIESTKAFATKFTVSGAMVKISPQKEMVLFRMVQEALHNIVKHSGAAAIDVAMQYSADKLQITVIDNGKGFDLTPLTEAGSKAGMGIHSMYNRAKLIDAVFNISSTTGSGTVITIDLPLNKLTD